MLDGAHAAQVAVVPGQRGELGELGHLATVAGAPFRQVGEQLQGAERADADRQAQVLHPLLPVGPGAVEPLVQLPFERALARRQRAEQRAQFAPRGRGNQVVAVPVRADVRHHGRADHQQVEQRLPRERGRRGQGRLTFRTESPEDRRVERVRLFQFAETAGVGARACAGLMRGYR